MAVKYKAKFNKRTVGVIASTAREAKDTVLDFFHIHKDEWADKRKEVKLTRVKES